MGTTATTTMPMMEAKEEKERKSEKERKRKRRQGKRLVKSLFRSPGISGVLNTPGGRERPFSHWLNFLRSSQRGLDAGTRCVILRDLYLIYTKTEKRLKRA